MKFNFSEKNKIHIFFLAVTLILGITVRLYGLNIQSLWFDELFSVVAASTNFHIMYNFWLLRDFHPPLFQLLLFYWVHLFGNSEIAVRLPSAIAGVLSILFIYPLSKKVFDRHIALSATILLSFSGAAIYYSQEARPYSFLLLFSTISTLLWLNVIKKFSNSQLKNKDLYLYIFAALLTCYTHYFGVIFIGYQILYLVSISFLERKYRLKSLLTAIMTGFLYSPWLFIHFSKVMRVSTEVRWVPAPDIFSLLAFVNFIFNYKIVLLLLIPVFASIRMLFLKETYWKLKEIKPDNTVLALIYSIFAPILTVFIISQHGSLFYYRYFIELLPSIYILIAVLISFNPDFNRERGTAYVFILSIISCFFFLFIPGYNIRANNLMNTGISYYKPHKQDWRAAVKDVLSKYDRNSVIIIYRDNYLYEYYLNKLKKSPDLKIIPNFNDAGSAEFFSSVAGKFSKIFVFSTFSRMPPQVEQAMSNAGLRCTPKDRNSMWTYYCLSSNNSSRE